MKKKYNYFDDEPEETTKKKAKSNTFVPSAISGHSSQKQKRIDLTKLPSVLKKIISLIGVYVVMISKKIFRFFRNHTKGNSPLWTGIIALVLVIVILCVSTVSIVMSTNSKRQSKQDEYYIEAAKICAEYSEKYGIANYKFMNSEYEVSGCMLTGLCVVREVDFDFNGDSELLLAYNNNDQYYTEVWGFSSGEFIKLYENKVFQTDNRNDDIWISLYYNNKEYYIAQHNEDDISDVSILKIHSDNFKEKTTATFNIDTLQYYIKDEKVTDDFERIRFAVLRENIASQTVDRTLDTIESFSANLDDDASENSTEITERNKQKQAYLDIVSKYQQEYGEASIEEDDDYSYISGLAIVNLIDFNLDGTDELMLIYRRIANTRQEDSNGNYIAIEKEVYYTEIYSFDGEKAKTVYQADNISNLQSDTDVYYYLINKNDNDYKLAVNTFDISESNNKIEGVSKILSFNGTSFSQDKKYSFKREYSYTKYYIGSEQIYSQKDFKDKGGYDVPFFDGTKTYDSSEWIVGFVQVEHRDASKLKGQLSQTEDSIDYLKNQD